MKTRQNWRVVPLLVALLVAVVTIEVLVHGTYCLAPSVSLEPGEIGTAETSVYGVPLYRATGTDHMAMYDKAVWWYQIAMLVEWVAAVATGVAAYLFIRWRGRVGPADQG